jgi:hypothetical protein
MLRLCITGLLLALMGCQDAGPDMPPPGPSPAEVLVTWYQNPGHPDTVIVAGDSLVIFRTFPFDTCCFRHLNPRLVQADSVLRVQLDGPEPFTIFSPYGLDLQVVIRHARPVPRLIVLQVSHDAHFDAADTIPVAGWVPATTLAPLQLISTWTWFGYPAVDTLSAVTATTSGMELRGTFGYGAFGTHPRFALTPTLTDSLLTLRVDGPDDFPLPSTSLFPFAIAVTALPPATYRITLPLFLGSATPARVLDTVVTVPGSSP